MSDNTVLQTKPKVTKTAKPTKWWHWVLMYPGLVIFMLGNVPTLQQLFISFKHEVPFTRAYNVKQQQDYWARNFDDLLEHQEFKKEVLEKDGVTVHYRIFKSGDILVMSSKGEENIIYRWIGFDELKPSSLSSLLSIDEALADQRQIKVETVWGAKTIICRKRLSGGRILVRVRYGSRGCFAEIIDTGSGRVLGKTRVSCERACE